MAFLANVNLFDNLKMIMMTHLLVLQQHGQFTTHSITTYSPSIAHTQETDYRGTLFEMLFCWDY